MSGLRKLLQPKDMAATQQWMQHGAQKQAALAALKKSFLHRAFTGQL